MHALVLLDKEPCGITSAHWRCPTRGSMILASRELGLPTHQFHSVCASRSPRALPRASFRFGDLCTEYSGATSACHVALARRRSGSHVMRLSPWATLI